MWICGGVELSRAVSLRAQHAQSKSAAPSTGLGRSVRWGKLRVSELKRLPALSGPVWKSTQSCSTVAKQIVLKHNLFPNQ